MHYRATHDALTGIWNRASIFSVMKCELERSFREKQSASFLLCDIDQFKQVNNQHGHLVGDTVLQEVAKRMTSTVRSNDAVCRYGGEEFLNVNSNCDERSPVARSESVRKAIASRAILAGKAAFHTSLSVRAITSRNWDPSIPLERILARADAALYRGQGRWSQPDSARG
jgi:two-component system cell cycle response regulator